MKPTIGHLWNEYARKVLVGLPRSSVQYKVTKRTFYAAAGSTLVFLREFIGASEMNEKEGIDILESFMKDIQDFLLAECEQFEREQDTR